MWITHDEITYYDTHPVRMCGEDRSWVQAGHQLSEDFLGAVPLGIDESNFE